MKRLMTVLVTLLLAVTSALAAAPAEAKSPYCGIRWGSLAKIAESDSVAPLTGVRTGRHTCYDRLVLDVSGRIESYSVWYATSIHNPITDAPIALRGGAFLQVSTRVSTHDASGTTSFRPADPSELNDVTSFRTFRQVALAGESALRDYSIIGLGVRARLPFRVFTLDGPGTGSRLVIDVAHRW